MNEGATDGLLNTNYLSGPKGSEDYCTFRTLKRTSCEEAIGKCEEEMFEMDMTIEMGHATVALLEKINSEIVAAQRSHKDQSVILKVDRHALSAGQLKMISKVYDSYGPAMLELLSKNAGKVHLYSLVIFE